jgi:hypothetical protein
MEFDPTLRVSLYIYIYIYMQRTEFGFQSNYLSTLHHFFDTYLTTRAYCISTVSTFFLTPCLFHLFTHSPIHAYTHHPPIRKLKAYFYFWMAASNDVETQQKGVVFLVWPTINKEGTTISQMIPNQTDRKLHIKCNEAAPIRICAVHFCFPNTPVFHLLRSVMTMTLGVSYRNRLKFHVGEGIELQYILKGFGIPIENLPITDTGNIKTTYLKQWLRVRKVIEVEMTPSGQSTKSLSIIECPRSFDVIFRPGTSMFSHPGNVTFRGLVESKQDRTTIKKTDKEMVALEIISDIQKLPNGGGRFLIWDNTGYWSDISNDIPTCVEKIAVSYRDYKAKIRHSNTNIARNNINATTTNMLTTSMKSLLRPNKTNNYSNSNSNKDNTTTKSINCSTYAFLGQQLDINKKRKRTLTTDINNNGTPSIRTTNNNPFCVGVGVGGGGGASSSSSSSSSSYQGCFSFP